MGASQRLCKAAKPALLKGEDALVGVIARSDRVGWPDPMVQASRIPADTDVVLVVTSHRLLVLHHDGRDHVGEPWLGVGPHNLLELDVVQYNPLTATCVIRYLDGSVTELTTLTIKSIPGLRAAFRHLLPKLDDLPTT